MEAHLSTEEGNVPTDYYTNQSKNVGVPHCVGNSCENLAALDNGLPVTENTEQQATLHAPPEIIAKPPRSEAAGNQAGRAPFPFASDEVAGSDDVYATIQGATAQAAEYYKVVERRSFDGERPVDPSEALY